MKKKLTWMDRMSRIKAIQDFKFEISNLKSLNPNSSSCPSCLSMLIVLRFGMPNPL
jgi:hypothetical protein